MGTEPRTHQQELKKRGFLICSVNIPASSPAIKLNAPSLSPQIGSFLLLLFFHLSLSLSFSLFSFFLFSFRLNIRGKAFVHPEAPELNSLSLNR